MLLEFVPLSAFGRRPAAELLTRAFADYLVALSFSEEQLQQMERADSLDFNSSLVAKIDRDPVAIALVARRGAQSRIAGMAVVPPARRCGIGRKLMERLIKEAQQRGEQAMVLEVIEQNLAAVRLYETLGFIKVRRLVGFSGPPRQAVTPVTDLIEVDLPTFAAKMTACAPPDWPWQLSGQSVAQANRPGVGYQQDGAWIWLLHPKGPTVVVRAMVVVGDSRQSERAEHLLRAAMTQHPVPQWHVGPIWPEECAGWFGSVGLVRQELTQWQMSLVW